MRKISPLTAIFFTILFDTLSFSVAIPDTQKRVDRLLPAGIDPGLGGLIIGLTIAIYSLAQFVIAPYLGRLSDQRGRRGVLLWTAALAALSSGLYIFATSLPIVAISRLLGGLAAGNLGVAQAYIADVSTPENRSKSMGVLGMAFGVGFMIGPPLGAFLLKIGQGSPVFIGGFSTIFALVNFAFIYFFVPESHKPEKEADIAKTNRWKLMREAFGTGALAVLLLTFFASNLAFSHLESTFFLVGEYVYKVDEMKTTRILIIVGLIAFVTQGFLIRKLTPILGERKLMRFGYFLTCPAMFSVPLVPFVLAYFGAIGLGIGSGLFGPSINSLISREAPKRIVGEIFGVTAALSAFARMVGPIVSNILFKYDPRWTYTSAAVLLALAFVASMFYRPSDQFDADEAVPAEK